MIKIVPSKIVKANVVTDLYHLEVFDKMLGRVLDKETYIGLSIITSRLGSSYITNQELVSGIGMQCDAYMADMHLVKHYLDAFGLSDLLDADVVDEKIINVLKHCGATETTIGYDGNEVHMFIIDEHVLQKQPIEIQAVITSFIQNTHNFY